MSTAIIHISDLHISTDFGVSCLNLAQDDAVRAFEDELLRFKKEKLAYDNIYLIISGDLANSANVDEYTYAATFITKLGINKNNILIIPGNHDINWDDNRKAHSAAIVKNEGKLEGVNNSYSFQSEKLNNFKQFYEKFYSDKIFEENKTITTTLKITDDKVLIIGLNSCEKCNYEKNQGVGYIEPEKLKQELKILLENNYSDFVKIVVCHHNPYINYSESTRNGFEHSNWQRVKSVLVDYGINTVLFGHEHTPGSDETNVFYYSAVGSLSKNGVDNVFNVIDVSHDDGSVILNIKHYGRQNPKNVDHPDGYWTLLPDSPFNKKISYNVKPKTNEITSQRLLPGNPELSIDKIIEQERPVIDDRQHHNTNHIKNKFEDEIFLRVKQLKLFKSGHFHWSDTSRAHNWIDIPKLLNDRNDIFLVQKSIIQAIIDNNIKFDLIIGLGIEGNIIASRAAANYQVPYTFLPYSYRYDDHAQYEKEIKLVFDGYKKVLIVTDVVHEGATIKKLLIDEHDFFDNKEIDEINVISLFFTAEKYSNDKLNDPFEKRFKFYYVSKIRVEECPYGNDKDWAKNCDLFCHKLDKVFEFYNRIE